jgi:hypothetical protein
VVVAAMGNIRSRPRTRLRIQKLSVRSWHTRVRFLCSFRLTVVLNRRDCVSCHREFLAVRVVAWHTSASKFPNRFHRDRLHSHFVLPRRYQVQLAWSRGAENLEFVGLVMRVCRSCDK